MTGLSLDTCSKNSVSPAVMAIERVSFQGHKSRIDAIVREGKYRKIGTVVVDDCSALV